jgi:pimeloyl-ACP methyl ester carboxylesterase
MDDQRRTNTPIESGLVDVNGARLYYEVAGAGSPLVLIHGFSLDHRMWDDQFEAFSLHHRVIRYDLRGFGRSSLPDGQPYSHTEDLRALLNTLGLDCAAVAGLSLGGWVATNFALAHPQSTQALILADSVLLGIGWSPEYQATFAPMWQAAGKGDLEAARRLWLGSPLFEPALQLPAVSDRLRHILAEYSGWHFVNDDPVGEPGEPIAQRLCQIRAPALVIVGERDMADFQAIAARLSAGIPGAHPVRLAQAGHMSNMEAPGPFNEVVLDFLNGVRKPRRVSGHARRNL